MTGYQSKKAAAQDKLAQPEQEPWCMKMNDCKTKCEDCPVEVAQPAQEPVANDRALQLVTHQLNHWVAYATELRERLNKYEGGAPMLLNITPPQRTWVDLTDDEISDIAINNPPAVHEFARAVLAKSKEQNNG
jgi:hypothetical protein